MNKISSVIYALFVIFGIVHAIYIVILPFTLDLSVGKTILGVLLSLFLGAPITIGLYSSIGLLISSLFDRSKR